MDVQAEVNKIEILNVKTAHISEFFADHNENIRSFSAAKPDHNKRIRNIINQSPNGNSIIAKRRVELRKLRRSYSSINLQEQTLIEPHSATDLQWKTTFNNTWFIKDNVSMYEDQSETLVPTHLNFTILKQRYNTFISSLKPIKNINGTINDINPNQTRCKHKGKVFVIGINKSGTTSLNAALVLLGYSHNGSFTYWFRKFKAFNPQRFNGAYFYFRHFYDKLNVMFMNKYLVDSLISESYNSYNFGDSPYCFLYEMMDKLYPNSKFILMRRASTWSIVNSNMKYAHNYGATPICQFERYNYRGMSAEDFANWLAMRYELHNQRVIEYFNKSNRINKDLLILDMENIIKQNLYPTGQQKVWELIMDFLECDNTDQFSIKTSFPHKNANKNVTCDILPEMYHLDWKTQFNHKIPIMYQNPSEYEGIGGSIFNRPRKSSHYPSNKYIPNTNEIHPRGIDVKLIMLNESIEHLF